MKKPFYITTAIDYANGPPHLGHAYEKVLTDVIARFRRLQGDEVYFLTGLDEHGQKVQQSARREGVEPLEFCHKIAEQFKDLWSRLLISNNDFIRTTEWRHKKVVRELLQEIYDKGEIYQAPYQGYYSVRAEQFVLERDKVDGKWPEVYGEVIELTETNYFFHLSKYQEWLVDYLNTHERFIFPSFRQKEVLEFLKEPINDLCISRPKERLSWGIPLPFDEKYVTYVWFDALVNYISALDYGSDRFDKYWPADWHVIGKDILVPNHTVYWPIMLKACDLELPQALLVHGWWLASGQKMSKSTGEAIDPLDLIDHFGPDAFRYFVTREMSVGQDSDFSSELFKTRYHRDLANDLGNLVNRLLDMGHRYGAGVIAPCTVVEGPEHTLQAAWEKTATVVIKQFERFQFHTALERIFTFIKDINRYVEIRAPWKLARSDVLKDRERLQTSLSIIAESLRLAAALLSPVTPSVSAKIYQLLGLEAISTWEEELAWSRRLEGNTFGEKTILFPRL